MSAELTPGQVAHAAFHTLPWQTTDTWFRHDEAYRQKWLDVYYACVEHHEARKGGAT